MRRQHHAGVRWQPKVDGKHLSTLVRLHHAETTKIYKAGAASVRALQPASLVVIGATLLALL